MSEENKKKQENEEKKIHIDSDESEIEENKSDYDENRKNELDRIRKWIAERRKNLTQDDNSKDKEDDEVESSNEDKDSKLSKDKTKQSRIKHDEKSVGNRCRRLPREVIEQIIFERNRLSVVNKGSADYGKIKQRLEYLEKLPWQANPYKPIDVAKAKTILDKEHYGMKKVKEEIIEYIYAINKLGKISNEILLLSGPPGTGKTSVARQIAKALGREIHKIPLGGLSDEVYIKGASRQYSNSKPGAIIDALYKIRHRNIVIILDEVDKLGSRNGTQEAASALLDALDQDNSFVDRFIDLPIDLSDIIFIATANDSSNIPTPLLDRMNTIEIMPYSKEDKIAICKKYIIPKVKEIYQLNRNMLKIAPEVIERIADEDTENAGVRGMSKKIEKICRIASKELVESGNKSYFMSIKRATSFNIISERIIHHINSSKVGKVITSGVDYTTGKESLLNVEAIFAEGRDDPEAIGSSIKSLYKDDIIQLWSYMVANKEHLKILEKFIKDGAVVINVEELTRFNYDTNHRLSIFCSMYSVLTKVILPQRHVIIGDVSLLGEVKSNRKTYGHIINALNSGAKVLIIPKELEKKVKTLIGKAEVEIFSIRDLNEMCHLYNKFYIYNCINKSQVKSNNQQPIEKLIACEKAIETLAEKEGITIKEAYTKHLKILKQENKVSAEKQLEKLIGLEKVKSIVSEIVTWQVVTNERKKAGLKVKNIGLHMILTGNPGTGKTTVAKILGKMLHEKKLTTNDRFIEVTRDDLVGKYIGHTEEKVKNIIQHALGGVLYIDEAHSLYVDSGIDYGKIVLSTLVKEMEENRANLIVIMSGYKEEMSEMVKLNVGLADRINYKIDFDDYSIEELTDIFMSLCKEEDYDLDQETVARFQEVMARCLLDKKKYFSNGRFVRNIFEKAKIKQAIRIGRLNEICQDDYKFIKTIDIVLAYVEETKYQFTDKKDNPIGFN